MNRLFNRPSWWAGLGVFLIWGVGVGSAAAQESGSVVGEVLAEETGRPIAGAQITIVGTTMGTLTQANGTYLMVNVPVGPVTVRVQFIGYATQEQSVTVRAGEPTRVDFTLGTEAIGLDEIVVTGTAGQARRREVGNSISQLSEATIEASPVRSPQDLLMGRVAGVSVLQNAGQPGAGGDIRLRGNNSISQGNRPLVYVDGVRMNAITDLQLVQAEEVRQMEYLAPTDATNRFGTDHTGGAILVTTR